MGDVGDQLRPQTIQFLEDFHSGRFLGQSRVLNDYADLVADGDEQLHLLMTQFARDTAEDTQHPQHFVLRLDGNARESA